MQSVHSRMRRTVEKENRDVGIGIGIGADRKIGGGNSSSSNNNNNNNDQSKKRRRRPRQRFNFCLLLLVLLPLAIIGVCIYVLIGPGASPNISKRLVDVDVDANASAEVNAAYAKKVKRLREEKRIVVDAERGRKMHEIPEKRTTEHKHEHEHKKIHKSKTTPHEFEFLVLTTIHGNIKITLRPDLSKGSVDYIHRLVESYGGNGTRCQHCQFYRSESPGILQGIMEHKGVVPVNTIKGSCPEGAEDIRNDCPQWDKQCGCHGPLMTRGAVAWAAGHAGGPDFFIDGYSAPSTVWGTQHTNFGFIEVDDHASLDVLDAIWGLPVEGRGGMNFLKDPIHFDLVLE